MLKYAINEMLGIGREIYESSCSIWSFKQTKFEKRIHTGVVLYKKPKKNNLTKVACKKVGELKRIETLLQTVLRYRGYNEKNLVNRVKRLEDANEISIDDKKILKKIMKRQKNIAGDLSSMLDYILMLYDVYDEEIKEVKGQLEEYVEK